MAQSVAEDQVPPGFLLERSESGVWLAVHPMYSAKVQRGSIYVRFMARTVLPEREGAEETEIDQINVDWFGMGYEAGATNVVILPQVLVRPEAEGGETWARDYTDPVRDLRYALVFRVDVDGVEPMVWDVSESAMPVILLAPPGTGASLDSMRAAELLSAVQERTGVRIQVLGDTISPDRILSGEAPVVIAYPNDDPIERLSLVALRMASLSRLLGGDGSLDPDLVHSAMANLSDTGREELRQKLIQLLTEQAQATSDLLAQLQAGDADDEGDDGAAPDTLSDADSR